VFLLNVIRPSTVIWRSVTPSPASGGGDEPVVHLLLPPGGARRTGHPPVVRHPGVHPLLGGEAGELGEPARSERGAALERGIRRVRERSEAAGKSIQFQRENEYIETMKEGGRNDRVVRNTELPAFQASED